MYFLVELDFLCGIAILSCIPAPRKPKQNRLGKYPLSLASWIGLQELILDDFDILIFTNPQILENLFEKFLHFRRITQITRQIHPTT